MHIRKAVAADRDVLFDIWLQSVRATHDFVSPEDIQSFIPLVKDYLASSEGRGDTRERTHGVKTAVKPRDDARSRTEISITRFASRDGSCDSSANSWPTRRIRFRPYST